MQGVRRAMGQWFGKFGFAETPPIRSFYRREMPEGLVALDSSEGRDMLTQENNFLGRGWLRVTANLFSL
jgi:hypothetical protein